jgi:hypothetical protein|tara:strand:- start:773 stop:1345 length:573 start_codon:yes stop_codon:yes gene_type:complete
MNSKRKYIVLLVLLFVISSCDKNRHVKSYRMPKTDFNIIKNDVPKDLQNNVRGLSWIVPESWMPSEGHSMRLASFDTPFSKGVGDLSIVSLGGSSGGLVANVNRWRKQLRLDIMTETQIQDISVSGESKMGPFKFFRLVNDVQKDRAILAVVLPMDRETLFIKLTASLDGINELETVFTKFCSTINRVSK